MTRGPALIPALVALAACSLQPTYVRPTPAVPASWPVGDAYLRASETSLPSISYRDVFRDPKLQAIIEQALVNNQDVKLALANVASARAQWRVQRAQLLPRIDASASGSVSDSGSARSRAAGGGSVGGGVNKNYSIDVGLSGFEVDLFGRLSSLSDAALQTYLATEAAARTARLSLVAELASAYYTLATDRSLLAIAIDTERSASRSVDLTRARLTGGIAPRTDLRQAETVYAQAKSDHADLITQVAQDRNAIELLVGAPVDGALLPASIESVDSMVGEIPAGLDSRILLRRPDVVDAEYQLRAANARIGAARAAFFPTISLTSIAGLASNALSSLFSGAAFNYSISPSVSLPLFDGGANRGNLADARAQRDAATASYQKAIQTAFRDVADALARRGTIASQYAAQAQLEAAARDSYFLADARYREGIDTFLTSLDAQRTLYSARQTLASTRLVAADSLVELYRALGGDQLIDSMPPPGKAPPEVR